MSSAPNEAQPSRAVADEGWFVFAPGREDFDRPGAIDLRYLNEKIAGENGPIAARDGQFVRGDTRKPIRFWAVNGPPSTVKDPAELRRIARFLASRGVNLVRIHTAVFNSRGDIDPAKIDQFAATVEAMRHEGIYTLFSIYFPLWLRPPSDTPWLHGYNGSQHPFGAIYFNPDFQAHYRSWWEALLNKINPATGQRLASEPSVMGLEMVNEDSLFFWTFNENNLPPEQLQIIETRFATWASGVHGSADAALQNWRGPRLERDAPEEGRLALRPLWNIFNQKTPRDQDTARFLFELQRDFYSATAQFLGDLGFTGVITASNWATASPEIFGPLEKLSYTTGDFLDRHGYFSCNHKGEFSEWSIRAGHTYSDRSALRFDSTVPGRPKEFVHPVMDPSYAGKPSMISETTWNRPNRFRSEAPLYYSVYGALQNSDAIVHFAHDGPDWSVKPNFWMQPWTLMSPAMIGQFPAAALIFREGLIRPGATLARLALAEDELFKLRGTPLPQDAALDELRLKDVPVSGAVLPGQIIDPLIHYAGQVAVTFTNGVGHSTLENLAPWIDRTAQSVTSSTRELHLDYGRGLLTINAPRVQGASGNLQPGPVETSDLRIHSPLDLLHVVVVSLDGAPIATSRRMLLQVMTEERPTGFRSESTSDDGRSFRIVEIGTDPWQVRQIRGSVEFKAGRPLRFQSLDPLGKVAGEAVEGLRLPLAPDVLYYLVTR